MATKPVYKSKQQALFEAWLQDGVCSKQNDSYHVFSQQEAKNRIKEFIEKQDYSSVKDIADQLKSSITLSDKRISKSLRVPFVNYAKLVRSALIQKTSLSTIVRNVMVKHLEKFVADATKRKDVKSQRLDLFQKVFKTWKTESRKAEQSPKDFYSPSMIYYPHLQKKVIKIILRKGIEQIRKKCSAIPPEVLDGYLKVDWETNIDELYETYADFFHEKILLNQNGQVVLNIEILACLTSNVNLEEYTALNREVRNQYGDEASQTLIKALDVDEEWVDDIGKLPICFRLNLLSIPLEIKHETLLVNNVVVKDEKNDEEIKLRYKGNQSKQLTILKSELDKAWKQEDWNTVSEISKKMVLLEEDYQLREYCLEIALKLFRKKHVISFRAPEIVFRAWEAYGESEFEHLNLEA